MRRDYKSARSRLGALAGAATLAAAPAAAQNLLERSEQAPAYSQPYYQEPRAPRPRPERPERPKTPPVTARTSPKLPPAEKSAAKPSAPGTAPAVTPSTDDNPPPYEPQLLRLSELLGALTYLQNLCDGHDGKIWRDKMSALMDAETQSQVRRERLAGAYNRGFQGYELSYRACTPNAQAVITRSLDESSKIARDMTHRYGAS